MSGRRSRRTQRTLGRWLLGPIIGRGGNGVVHRATSGAEVAALKVLKTERLTPGLLARFQDEVRAMRRCQGIDGVLPLMDSFELAALEGGETPWLAMALAKSIRTNVGLEATCRTIWEIAVTLSMMHEHGVSHRDLKPENLFVWNGRGAVGDLGLAKFDGKEAHTRAGAKLGPVYYIAPEMLNSPDTANGNAADVYSLAKTLWVLATGQRYPLPGQHDPRHEAFRIGSYVANSRGSLLDGIVAAATSFAPGQRPTMRQVAAELEAWLNPLAISAPKSPFDLSDVAHAMAPRRESIEVAGRAEDDRLQRERAVGQRFQDAVRPVGEVCS